MIRQKNQYLGAARNNGARVARGEFLMFLDDDNIALPNMIATLVKAAQHSGAAIAVNGHYNWRAVNSGVSTLPTPLEMRKMAVWTPVGPAICAGLKGNVYGNANFLVSKNSFFAMSGFSEDRAGWEDYEFHAKAAISGLDYVVVPEPLMLYRLHSQDQMSAVTDGVVNFDRVLRAYQQLFSEAGVVHHRVHERSVAQCSITSASYTETVNQGGVNVGVCTSLRVTVVTRDSVVPTYLGVQETISVCCFVFFFFFCFVVVFPLSFFVVAF